MAWPARQGHGRLSPFFLLPRRTPISRPACQALLFAATGLGLGGQTRSLCCTALVLSLPLVGAPLPVALQLRGLMATPGPQGQGLAAVVPMPLAASPEASGRPMQAASGSDRYRITPERRALLNTIRFAEGTWTGGRVEGYRMLYGGGLIGDLARHPEISVRRGYVSAAAGAYQFLPGTWREAARSLGLRDFGPSSQDQAALYLIEKRGVLTPVDREGLTGKLLARLAPEWSSLPTASGRSYYGQPVRDCRDLIRFYNDDLRRQRVAPSGGSLPG